MSGSILCIPRNKTVQPPYFQYRIIMFCLPIPTLIFLWEIYILYFEDRSVYFAAVKHVDRSQTHECGECGNWDWGRAISRKGIPKWDFNCSARLYLAEINPFRTRNRRIMTCRRAPTARTKTMTSPRSVTWQSPPSVTWHPPPLRPRCTSPRGQNTAKITRTAPRMSSFREDLLIW